MPDCDPSKPAGVRSFDHGAVEAMPENRAARDALESLGIAIQAHASDDDQLAYSDYAAMTDDMVRSNAFDDNC